MHRPTWVLLAVLLLLAVPLAAEAQEKGKVYRIGWLGPVLDGTGHSKPFLEKFRELGWVQGKDFIMEYRLAPAGGQEQLPALGAQLVQAKVDVIVAVSTPGAIAAKQATTTIPVVMAGVDRPVQRGLIATLARPRGNVTGLINSPGKGFHQKQGQLLMEAVPMARRVAILLDANFPHGERIGVPVPGRTAGVTVLFVEARDEHDLPEAFAAITRAKMEALQVPPLALAFRGLKQIVDFATTHRLPAIFGAREFVEAGGLMSYWTDWDDLKRRSAVYVDKILRGARPAELPVEQPAKFELIINLKTAKTLGLTIPRSLLLRADEVIE